MPAPASLLPIPPLLFPIPTSYTKLILLLPPTGISRSPATFPSFPARTISAASRSHIQRPLHMLLFQTCYTRTLSLTCMFRVGWHLQIGCGAGLPGICAATLGGRVVITDKEEALPIARANVEANLLSTSVMPPAHPHCMQSGRRESCKWKEERECACGCVGDGEWGEERKRRERKTSKKQRRLSSFAPFLTVFHIFSGPGRQARLGRCKLTLCCPARPRPCC